MSIFSTDPEVRVNTRGRHATLTWKLGPAEPEGDVPFTATTQLMIKHDKRRQCFLVSVGRFDIARRSDNWTETRFTNDGIIVRLTSRPVARYSEKAFREAIDAALAELRHKAFQDDTEIAAVADPTSPA